MRFNSDFTKNLREFNRLPMTTVSEAMQVFKSEKDLKQQIDFMVNLDSQEQKAKLDQFNKLNKDL